MKYNIALSFLGIVVALASATPPLLIGKSINLYLSQDDFYLITLVTACILILATPALRLSANVHLQKIASKTRYDLKKKLLQNLLFTNFWPSRGSGEFIDLIDGDVDNALYLYHGVYLDTVTNATLIALALSIIGYFYPVMIVAPSIAIIFSITMYTFTRVTCNNIYTEYVKENTTIINRICELLTCSEGKYSDSLEINIKKINKLALISSLKSSLAEAASGSSYLLGMSTMIIIGFYAVNNNLMSTGAVFASAMYIERVLSPTTALISIYTSSREAFYRRSRIYKHIK